MRLPGKATIPRLEATLASQLQGTPLFEWAERTTLEVLRKAGQNCPPIEMSDHLLKSRKVDSVEFVGSLPERARLEVRRDGFGVQMDSRFSRNLFWRRFLLAHELAHTLFYQVESEPPASRLLVRPGNSELEWLCSYLAKCLLMPIGALREIWHSETGKARVDISILFRLSQRFLLPWSIVAERLVQDAGLWRVILLHWQLERNCEDPSWRLVWQVAPADVPPGLFIPIGRRQPSGEMRYPRAKGQLAKLLYQLASSEEGAAERVPLSVTDLKIGNLQKILSESPHSCERVDWTLVGRNKSGTFEWVEPQPRKSILISVQLDKASSAAAFDSETPT